MDHQLKTKRLPWLTGVKNTTRDVTSSWLRHNANISRHSPIQVKLRSAYYEKVSERMLPAIISPVRALKYEIFKLMPNIKDGGIIEQSQLRSDCFFDFKVSGFWLSFKSTKVKAQIVIIIVIRNIIIIVKAVGIDILVRIAILFGRGGDHIRRGITWKASSRTSCCRITGRNIVTDWLDSSWRGGTVVLWRGVIINRCIRCSRSTSCDWWCCARDRRNCNCICIITCLWTRRCICRSNWLGICSYICLRIPWRTTVWFRFLDGTTSKKKVKITSVRKALIYNTEAELTTKDFSAGSYDMECSPWILSLGILSDRKIFRVVFGQTSVIG